jgi:hypothetical protein
VDNREPGVNPGRARRCNPALALYVLSTRFLSTSCVTASKVSGKAVEREGKSEDLPENVYEISVDKRLRYDL